MRKTTTAGVPVFLVALSLTAAVTHSQDAAPERAAPQRPVSYPADLLPRIRHAATAVPGALPTGVNYLKVAESHRPRSAVIEGGSDERFVSARTAFQVLYPDGTVMIDSGMDATVHAFYGFGRQEPYWEERNDTVQASLRQANLIVVTHEHGDHVAGVVRSAHRAELAPRTLLTAQQADTLVGSPQLPEIRLSAAQVHDYLVLDYELYLPVAPGMVLIKSPGHTPGHQMVYTRLDDGRELLFIGDIAWTMDNVTELRLRPTATIERIGEDPEALMAQLRWVKQVMEEGVVVIPAHDDVLLTGYAQEGLLGAELLVY